MKIKEHAALVGRYLLARLQEPSTMKGLVMAISALGWAKLDHSSQGEAVAQMGLLVIGIINAALPQRTLYAGKDDVR
jgi:hypothetical protein